MSNYKRFEFMRILITISLIILRLTFSKIRSSLSERDKVRIKYSLKFNLLKYTSSKPLENL